MSPTEIVEAFGRPDRRRDDEILIYDAVELHFVNDRLWLVHSEFGLPPLPPHVSSPKLGISPDGLEWPLRRATLEAAAHRHGLTCAVLDGPTGAGLRFGLASVVRSGPDQSAAWSVVSAEFG